MNLDCVFHVVIIFILYIALYLMCGRIVQIVFTLYCLTFVYVSIFMSVMSLMSLSGVFGYHGDLRHDAPVDQQCAFDNVDTGNSVIYGL